MKQYIKASSYIASAMSIVDTVQDGNVTITKQQGKARRKDRLTGKSVWKEITSVNATHSAYPGTEFWLENDHGERYATFSVDSGPDPDEDAVQEVEDALFKYYGL